MSVDGYVLAGGRGRRMGADKARMPHHGLPLAAWVAEQLAPCRSVTVVRRAPGDGRPWVRRDGTALRVRFERDDGPRHPLAGVVEALADTDGDRVLVAPCDLVGLTSEAVGVLLEAGPCVASDGERAHPLLAVLPTAWLPRARALLAAEGACRELVAGLPEVRLPPAALANVNRRDGLVDPIEALAHRLPAGEVTPRLRRGERLRLEARGVRFPGPDRVVED